MLLFCTVQLTLGQLRATMGQTARKEVAYEQK
jgi:hypothetical protein